VAVNPDLMFKNYLYVSGTTKTLRDYFDWFAKYMSIKYGGKKVLDIACNDGTQLESFKNLGFDVYGVDPAENLAEKSRAKGVNLTVEYWNEKIAETLPKMDIITAQNVFAHNSNPSEFLKACSLVMDDDSILAIQTSQADMFTNNEFDTIYHEHISFFCVNSMDSLCKRNGFVIWDVLKPSIHGNSYVFILKKMTDWNYKTVVPKVARMIEQERRDIVFYDNWANKVKKIVQDLKTIILEHKAKGFKVVGYGAAAKGNTLLNFGNIALDYIVDDNEMKHGFLTPGMNIPIKAPSALESEDNLLVVPLAWNFFNEIKGKVKIIRKEKNTKFVLYFPVLQQYSE
jgi:ubiquinone/menaquinone biosynthesis C-methylase UbiE